MDPAVACTCFRRSTSANRPPSRRVSPHDRVSDRSLLEAKTDQDFSLVVDQCAQPPVRSVPKRRREEPHGRPVAVLVGAEGVLAAAGGRRPSRDPPAPRRPPSARRPDDAPARCRGGALRPPPAIRERLDAGMSARSPPATEGGRRPPAAAGASRGGGGRPSADRSARCRPTTRRGAPGGRGSQCPPAPSPGLPCVRMFCNWSRRDAQNSVQVQPQNTTRRAGALAITRVQMESQLCRYIEKGICHSMDLSR